MNDKYEQMFSDLFEQQQIFASSLFSSKIMLKMMTADTMIIYCSINLQTRVRSLEENDDYNCVSSE